MTGPPTLTREIYPFFFSKRQGGRRTWGCTCFRYNVLGDRTEKTENTENLKKSVAVITVGPIEAVGTVVFVTVDEMVVDLMAG